MPKARAAAQRAIQLDHQNGEAYTALGSVQTIYECDWTAAEQNLTGVLCKAITAAQPTAQVFAVEINSQLCELLSQTINPPEDKAAGISKNVLQGDFLEVAGLGNQWDRIVMNPPFADGADIRHISHALKHLKPGGRLVAICANGPRQNEKLRPVVETHGGAWQELPAHTFISSGTSVRTVLLSMTAAVL